MAVHVSAEVTVMDINNQVLHSTLIDSIDIDLLLCIYSSSLRILFRGQITQAENISIRSIHANTLFGC